MSSKVAQVIWMVEVVGLGAVTLSLTAELIGWLRRQLRPPRTLNEVLFFPTEMACVEHIFTGPSPHCSCLLPHGLETSFSRLLRHIMSASSSLDLCIFAFSNSHLCRAVVELHNRGVAIRVLTDNNYAAIAGSQIGILRKAGICVHCFVGVMHHKFAVVDGRMLITGSLNWTWSAVQNNMENLLITDQPDLVKPFTKEFQRLWQCSDLTQNIQSEPVPS